MMRAPRLLSLFAVLAAGSASAQVIASNTTWSGAVTLDRDVRINPGVTVTVSPGAVITVAASDAANLGNNTTRVEIIVQGTLTVNGTGGSPVTFTSAGSAAGAWAGIEVEAGATLTATSLTIDEATAAVASSGTTTLTSCTLRTSTYGVQATAGVTNVNASLLTANSYAVYGTGGSVTVDHSTLVSNSYGVYSGSASGAVTVNNSIVTNNSNYGLYRGTGAATINNSNDDVWGNSTNYGSTSPGSGNISANPLYVVPGSNYRLTSNSPARKSDSGGLDLGAFPYLSDPTPGLHGTLWANTTVNSSTTVAGDLTVAPGVTLTLASGVTLTMSTSDLMQSGDVTGRVELIVRGVLDATGATFTSSGSAAGAWSGLRVEAGGSAVLTGSTVEEATSGLEALGSITFSSGTLRANTYGVQASSGVTNLNTTLLTGNTYAVYGAGGAVTVDHCTLVSNSYGVYSGASSGSVTVNNSIVTNNSSYGLYRGTGAATITNSYDDVWQNSTNYGSTSPGTGNFSANPLYVASGSNYRLTSNSPARNSDSTGGDLGAFPYTSDATTGLVGTLWNNVTLSTGTMTGDVIIPVGVTVTVPAGVVLTAASNDALQAGDQTTRVELIVRGTLNVTGTSSLPTTFTATGSTAGSWSGVRVEAGGTFTASGLIIEKATSGLENSGTVTVTGGALRNNTYGLQANAGTASISTSLFSANSYGVYGSGGGVTIDHGTLVSNSYGVYSGSSSGSLTVTNSVITNNSSYGLYRGTGAASITNSFNDVWQNSTNYGSTSPGTGNLSSNPLYVVSGSNYRLTSNSPARNSDSTGGDMGALPYVSDATPGLYGTLWVNTTLTASAALQGDLTVPAGITLTVGPGVTLTAPASDIMVSGDATSRTELIVRGTLAVNGASGSPTVFTSTGSSAGAWTGIRLEPGSTATLTGAIIEEASSGVDNAGSLVINGSTLRTNTYGVQATGGNATVGTSLFHGNSYGGYAAGGVLTVDHATLVSNSYAVYAGSSSGSVSVNNSVITNNSSYGLYRSTGAVSITNSYNDVWQNSTNYGSTSPGTGSFSANPLYVTSGSNYRLTSNSPARRSDSLGGDLGAFPYLSDQTAGLVGTLWMDTTLSANGTLLGDLTVGPGVTLTVSPGVTLTAGASDLMVAGDQTSRVELIVRGTLTVNASSSDPVVFTATGASAGSWTGIRVESGGAATLTGVTITRASAAIEANANVSVNDSTLSANTYGMQINAGSSNATRTLFTGNSYGVYGLGGVVSIDHSTLVSNSYGVYSGSSSGSVSVTNSVITNNSSYGLYRGTGATSINNSYDDVWQNSTNYGSTSPGTGNISSNPLYVSMGSNYRLTSNSPARKSDSLGGDLGAFPYLTDQTPGLVGTLWTSTTLSASAALLGDLTVAPGVTVTVAPGVTLTAPANDLMISGDQTTRTELIVLGTLQLSGTPASPVVLTATGATAGSWAGVRVKAGGTANITSATIQRATACLDLYGDATVTSSRLSTCTYGVRANAGTATVNFTVLDANSYGVYGAGGASSLDHATLYGNSYGLYSGASTGSLSVQNAIITNHSSYGLYRGTGATAITNSYNLLFSAPLGSTTLGANSLTVDPLLVAPASADFRLQSTSPARSAGTSASDLGAFPFAPGAVDRVVIAPSSATMTAGSTFTFTATAYDAANNPVPTATFTWTSLGSAGVIDSSGVLTASCTPGSITNAVTATANGISGSANVVITTAPIASLVVTPANATVRSQQSQQFMVTALDVCNNPVASPSVSWVATGSAGIISATGQYTAGCTRGSFPLSIVATAGSVSGRASVTVDPGVLFAVSLSPTSATLAVNGSRQFTGSAADGCGNPLTSTITYGTTVTGGNVSTSGLFTAGATPGTFNNGVTASATEGAITRSASANVTVTGGAVATVTVMPSTATLPTGGTTNFLAVAADSLGNMVPGTPSWTVVAGGGSISSTGTFTAGPGAGTFTNTVQATISGVSGFATVIVQPGAVTRVVVSPMSVTLAPSGTTTFTAQALDANDNPVTAPVTWTATAASGAITQGGVFTAGTMSGNYPAAISATVNGVSGSSSVIINAGALAQLTLTPSVANTQAGGTIGFAATGRDGNGNTVVVAPTWSVVAGGGTISPAGVFSAGTATGTFANTVRAESNGVTAFATVTVSPGPLARLELTPSSATLDPGAAQQFTGAGQDAFGNPVTASITWSANSNAGSITAGGLFTAGNIPGDFLDGVTATAGNVTATASIRVGTPVVADAGVDAGMEVDAGTDAGMTQPDAGMTESDAGTELMPDGGSGTINGKSGCGCTSADGMAPLFGLLMLAFARRRRR